MKRDATIVCLLLLSVLICSCASQPLPPPKLEPAPEAIRVHITSKSDLNYYNNASHSLVVCVYQINSPNGLNQLGEDEHGINKLRRCGLFDTTVTRAKRVIARPGENLNMALDRAEGTKYVAIVAGYEILEKERIVRIYEIPVVEETKGFFRRTKMLKLAPLDIKLVLGAKQIES